MNRNGGEILKSNDMTATWSRTLKCVICVWGAGRIGKSETVTAISQSFQAQSRFFYEQKGQSGSRDRRIVLKYRGLIIGIATAGDDQNTIDRNFAFFDEMKCDYAITAARVEGTNNMKLYASAQAKARKAKFVDVEKTDVKTRYARAIVKAGCVDRVHLAFAEKGERRIIQRLKDK